MSFLPVNFVSDVNGIQSGVQRDVLYKLRLLPMAGDPDGRTKRPSLHDFDRIRLVELCEVVFEIRVDIPGIVVLGCVFESDEFVSTTVRRNLFEVRLLVKETRNTTRFLVNDYPKN